MPRRKTIAEFEESIKQLRGEYRCQEDRLSNAISERDKARISVSSLKGTIAKLTEENARMQGYIDKVIEDDTIGRDVRPPARQVDVPMPLTRQGPGKPIEVRTGHYLECNRNTWGEKRNDPEPEWWDRT